MSDRIISADCHIDMTWMPDGIWPDSQKWIAEDLASVSPAVRRKILCENAGKLYGLL